MYRCGFVSNEYTIEAIYQSNTKRHNSAKKNHKRLMYESVENNKELKFGEMLNDEMEKLRGIK